MVDLVDQAHIGVGRQALASLRVGHPGSFAEE